MLRQVFERTEHLVQRLLKVVQRAGSDEDVRAAGFGDGACEADASLGAVVCELFAELFCEGQVVDHPIHRGREIYFALVGVKEIADVTTEIEDALDFSGERGEEEKNGIIA